MTRLVNKRPATISDIENGNSDINALTIVSFVTVLEKPISYFFPAPLLLDNLLDVSTSFEYKMIEMDRNIQTYGNMELTLDILNALVKHFDKESEREENGFDSSEFENENDEAVF